MSDEDITLYGPRVGTGNSRPLILMADGTPYFQLTRDGVLSALNGGTISGAVSTSIETWTPTIGGATSESGQSYLFQNGLYVKNGPLVHIWGLVALSVEGTITGNLRIKGLPYASVSTVVQTVTPVNWSGLTTTWATIQLVLNPSSSAFLVVGAEVPAVTANTALDAGDVEAGSAFSFSTTYLTSS